MTKPDDVTSVFAMGKGMVEHTSGQSNLIDTDSTSRAAYQDNFLYKAIYKTPLNPLLTRGVVSSDLADFTAASVTTSINSYEIHKADGATLTNSVRGINTSNSGTQTYSSVNRKYPNSTTISDHLSNLETTRGNILKTYDYNSVTGQRFLNKAMTINVGGGVNATQTTIVMDGGWSEPVEDDILVVNNEEMLVTAWNGATTVVTVVRGYNNTVATTHSDNDIVFKKDSAEHLWVLIYSDDANTHHFAKVTEILEHDVWGDAIEFTPSLKADIPKDTKFAIFDSSNTNFSELNSDNQTLVACGYGLQSETTVFTDTTCDYNDGPTITHNANDNIVVGLQVSGTGIPNDAYILSITSPTEFELSTATTGGSVTNGTLTFSTKTNNRHYLNTHVSRPFFYFLNGKDRLEPATRYVLRSSSWNGSSHTYTYSTFVTDQEYGTDIIDYSPYTMEATLVDMMYRADDPAAVDYLEFSDNTLDLNESANPDTITVGGSESFISLSEGGANDLDGERYVWNLNGILRDSRIAITGGATSGNNTVYNLKENTDATTTTLTLDDGMLTGDETSNNNIKIHVLSSSVDLDHNQLYSTFDSGSSGASANVLKNAFRMAHRPNNDDGFYHSYAIGHTRYMHYTDSPLTNNIAPNAMEMTSFESITSSGGYVDIVFADTQKILAKKLKEGDNIYIHKIISNEEVDKIRNQALLGTFNYNGVTLTVDDLENESDIRFSLESSIPRTNTSTVSKYDPLYDAFTINASGTIYHIIPDRISNPSSGSQTITVRRWRKDTDTEYTTGALSSVPNFSTTGYRKKYSFLADNILTSLDIDSKISGYSLNYDGDTAQPTKWNINSFDNFFKTGASLNMGDNILEKAELTRVNDVNLVLRGGMGTGHRINVEYGDSHNKLLKLKTHLKDERFLESYNKTDYLPYADGLSNVSLYGHTIDTSHDPQGSGANRYRYDLNRSPSSTSYTHTRGILSYLDYFKGNLDIEKRVFGGIIESIEQVVEDGMFKLKLKGRDRTANLLGPIVNKDYKFTEDIIYSTIGPVEKMSLYGSVNHSVAGTRYEVGTTVIRVDRDTNSIIEHAEGDLLFTSQGVFLGRIYDVSGSDPNFVITFEEGIPTTLKDDEVIMISSQFNNKLSDIAPDEASYSDSSHTYHSSSQFTRGNTISFAKALSANPYSTTRVNSLSGAGDKGIIFTGGNSLTLNNEKAPVGEGSTLIGTSSGSHALAKGYSINAPNNIDFDLPFYCHLADEITNKYTIDFVNLHTVNSLTDYDIVNINSKDNETVIEVAPICPVVLGRVDNNPLDSRDKYLVSVGSFGMDSFTDATCDTTDDPTITHDANESIIRGLFVSGSGVADGAFISSITNTTEFELSATTSGGSLTNTTLTFFKKYPKGYQGTFQFSTWIEELNEGDFIFDSNGDLFGKIIDISSGSNDGGKTNNMVSFTLDRPLFKEITTTSEGIYKYYGEASPPQYYSASDFDFDDSDSINNMGGTKYKVGVLTASSTASKTFLSSLSAGMRIHIEGHDKGANNGVFTIGHVFEDDSSDDGHIICFTRKYEGTKYTNTAKGVFEDSDLDNTIRITVLTDYFTQGLYFLNTQGLGQGGVVTLTNSILSSPNASDNIRKPVKWSGGLYHYITDTTVGKDSSGQYNPNSSAHLIYSDFIDRYGNFKWRYFGLQKGKYLSHINRRRKDGLIKDAYTTEKGRVNGYATAYRIADATFGRNKLMKYPYGYHNNDFAWAVKMNDAGGTIGMLFDNKAASFTNNTCDTNDTAGTGSSFGSNPRIIQMDSTSLLKVGMSVTGTGITNTAYITQIDSGTLFRIDRDVASDQTNTTLTFVDDNLIKTHPYFLEYLSPESRDFRPVMGSNFADFDKYGTTIYSPDEGNYQQLIYPRYMPRMHDNYRGGDWQEDNDIPFNIEGDEITLPYRKWGAVAGGTLYDYDIEWDGGNGDASFIDPAASDTSIFTKSLENNWVKLGGWPDRNNNRSFRLKGISGSKLEMATDRPPFTQIGVHTLTNQSGVGGSEDTTTGFETISILYPPFIGPKFDGITRAKDHWELPDPKTMRWFIFSPSDLYPDSMARKNHIGYSANSVSRKFTDYNLLLKGESSFTSSNTIHEFYEGSLEEEQETDNQYETLPISEAVTSNQDTMLPSNIKRFGLMRLIECTYDWHFNLIDPEKISSVDNMSTPNFEYTRYQPLVRLDLEITAYGTNDTVLTLSANPASLLNNGDQLFTDKGYYIGKVKADNTSSTSLTLVSGAKKPILKSDGTACLYYGNIFVCGKNTTLQNQDWSDSFYKFKTMGKIKNNFCQASDKVNQNMLQQMWSGQHNNYDSATKWKQIPYATIDSASGANGTAVTSFGINTTGLTNDKVTDGLPAPAFLNHFNENFSHFGGNDNSNMSEYGTPVVALPPAFRSFYSASFSSVTTDRTINAMQSKEHLVNGASKTITPFSSGVRIDAEFNGGAIWEVSTSSSTISVTSGYSADIHVGMKVHEVGDILHKGYVKSVTGTEGESVTAFVLSHAGYPPPNMGSPINGWTDTSGTPIELEFVKVLTANSDIRVPVDTVDATTQYEAGDVLYDDTGAVVGLISSVTANVITLTGNNIVALSDNDYLYRIEENPVTTEYIHPSNVLEWIQEGGNPYWRCEVVCLDRYSVENKSKIQTPIGGRTQIGTLWGHGSDYMVRGFPFSKPARTSTPTGANLALQTYGDGFGKITSAYGNTASSEYTFLGALGWDLAGFGTYRGDNQTALTGHISTVDRTYEDSGTVNYKTAESYVADGVIGAFIPNLYLYGIKNTTLSGNAEGQEGTITFSSVAGSDVKEGVIRIEMKTKENNHNPFLNFVDLTGMYLVGNIGTRAGVNSEHLDNSPFRITDAAGATITADYGLNFWGDFDALGAIQGKAYSKGWTGMNNTMVNPQHIIYVKEHRRNITGATVAHELLIDNIPTNHTGAIEFFDNYRIMRPAETCLWKNSPNEINLYNLSGNTTKKPTNEEMYGDVPSLLRVNSEEEFIGADIKQNINASNGLLGLNEGVMSMYVAIDPDARHAQYKDLTGTVTIDRDSNQLTGSSTLFTTELQEGDVIKLGNQKCYIKSIEDNTHLTIAGKFVGDADLNGSNDAYLFNNTHLVLRDYIHLFNPTGNRNTFKSGLSYGMLLTDGISKQKISMSVNADYYDDRALCKLSIGKIENDMLGIVSFGETFILKSNKMTRAETYSSARIGSTVVMGQEVEDVINDLLSSEDIEYDIQDDREYPYYISPNFQGIDVLHAANFAARYKEKELRINDAGISLINQTNKLDYKPIELNYETDDYKVISVTRNKSTFDLYNEIIVYGNGVKALKRNRKSIEKFGKKTLEDVNMELITQDDVDSRAKSLLSAHSNGEDRFTVKMTTKGIEFIKAGDIVTLDFPAEGIDKGQYKIYEIRRELTGLIELEVGTYRKDLANRFAELSIQNKSNAASIRGSRFTSTTAPLDFFGSIKLKELRLVIKKISLADSSAFTLGFQTEEARKLDFGTPMQPLETVTEIITDEDFI